MRDLLIMLGVVLVLLIAFTRGSLLSIRNFQSIAFQLPEFTIFTFAMLLPIIAGGINLSTIATAGVSGVVTTAFLTGMAKFLGPQMGAWIIIPAIIVALGVSALCALVNGILIGYIQVSPILVTLGTLTLFNGISLLITRGNELSGLPESFVFIGHGTVVGIPLVFLILIVISLVVAYLMNTQFGFKMSMIGANPTAAFYSGINNAATLLKTYLVSGLLCGVSSIIMTARYNSAKPDYGSSYLLQSILAVIMGGSAVTGGFGNVTGTLVAILILQLISSGFNMLGIQNNNYFVDVIWGVLLVAMITVSLLRSMRKGKATS